MKCLCALITVLTLSVTSQPPSEWQTDLTARQKALQLRLRQSCFNILIVGSNADDSRTNVKHTSPVLTHYTYTRLRALSPCLVSRYDPGTYWKPNDNPHSNPWPELSLFDYVLYTMDVGWLLMWDKNGSHFMRAVDSMRAKGLLRLGVFFDDFAKAFEPNKKVDPFVAELDLAFHPLLEACRRKGHYHAVWGADQVALRPDKTSRPMILFESYLHSPMYRIEGVMGALQQLRQEGMDLHIVSLGRGHPYADLKLAKVEPREIWRLWSRAWVYITAVPGSYELPVVETQMAGSYLLSVGNVTKHELYVAGKTGWVVEGETMEAVKANTRRLLLPLLEDGPRPEVPRQWALSHHTWELSAVMLLEGFLADRNKQMSRGAVFSARLTNLSKPVTEPLGFPTQSGNPSFRPHDWSPPLLHDRDDLGDDSLFFAQHLLTFDGGNAAKFHWDPTRIKRYFSTCNELVDMRGTERVAECVLPTSWDLVQSEKSSGRKKKLVCSFAAYKVPSHRAQSIFSVYAYDSSRETGQQGENGPAHPKSPVLPFILLVSVDGGFLFSPANTTLQLVETGDYWNIHKWLYSILLPRTSQGFVIVRVVFPPCRKSSAWLPQLGLVWVQPEDTLMAPLVSGLMPPVAHQVTHKWGLPDIVIPETRIPRTVLFHMPVIEVVTMWLLPFVLLICLALTRFRVFRTCRLR